MLTYRFDEKTKEYLVSEQAFLDPLESQLADKEIYLLPANSTFTKPLDPKEGYAVVWENNEWIYKEDHRQKRDKGGVIIETSGTPYWLEGDTYLSPARYMKELGELPEGAILVKPEKPLEKYIEEKHSELSSKFNTIQDSAYLTSSLGFTINAGRTAKADIDGLIESLQDDTTSTVLFRCYDNSFINVNLNNLKTMRLEVIKSGQELYQQKWTFGTMIDNCTSSEEVEAINIEFTMLDFSK